MDRNRLLANALANSQGNVLNRAFNTPSQGDVRKADQLAQALEMSRSVMSQPSTPYVLEMDRPEQGLEAPPIAPDDLIGTGLLKALGIPIAAALGVTAIGSKAAGSKAPALAQALRNQRGAIAWHGSPHKFDKFGPLDEVIGTGEGAQAYGHGLYLAEAPAVSGEYIRAGRNVGFQNWDNAKTLGEKAFAQAKGDTSEALRILDDLAANAKGETRKNNVFFAKQMLERGDQTASLYKTDIPDEALARFLDWDKPLSQQAPEVQAALVKSGKAFRHVDAPAANNLAAANRDSAAAAIARGEDVFQKISSEFGDSYERLSPFGVTIAPEGSLFIGAGKPTITMAGQDLSGADIYKKLAGARAGVHVDPAQEGVSQFLEKHGIPGIRYLDGGSRGAGQGTSNYVIFDPEMIRILERNGQPTGLQPWGPGEWNKRMAEALK